MIEYIKPICIYIALLVIGGVMGYELAKSVAVNSGVARYETDNVTGASKFVYGCKNIGGAQ